MTYFWNLIQSGGVLVYPLFLCGFIGLVLSLERSVFWLRLVTSYSTFDVERVYTLISHKQFEEAKEIFINSKDPSLVCLKLCIASKGRIHSQILQSLAQQKLDRAKKSMGLLETVITVSPLLGILGTVLGIISSVTGLSSGPAGGNEAFDSQIMISGLSEALVTTAIGLVISITGLVVYGYFKGQLDELRAKFERDLSAFESLV